MLKPSLVAPYSILLNVLIFLMEDGEIYKGKVQKQSDKEKYHSLSLGGQKGLVCMALGIPESIRVEQDDCCSL